MTTMKPTSRRGRRLLKRFDRAAQDFAIKGCMMPDDADAATREYDAAKAALETYMREQEARG